MGEVAAFAHRLSYTGVLQAIDEQVRFARASFGTYDLIDVAVVLLGYLLAGEPTSRSVRQLAQEWAASYGTRVGLRTIVSPHQSVGSPGGASPPRAGHRGAGGHPMRWHLAQLANPARPTNCATRLRNQKERALLLAREEGEEVHVHALTRQPEKA